MPRHVDHGARRDLVARTAADLVAEEGLEALTVRRVADAAGYSTTVVSHYFTDRRDLLVSTYRAAAARSSDRFDEALVGAHRVQACLEALLPLDEPSRRDWRTWFAFWGMAVADRELAREQDARVQSARQRIARVLAGEAGERRLVGTDTPEGAADVAYRLLVLVHGLGQHAVFDPGYWTPERQRQEVAAELAQLRVTPATARTARGSA